jgi:hypothetical protein
MLVYNVPPLISAHVNSTSYLYCKGGGKELALISLITAEDKTVGGGGREGEAGFISLGNTDTVITKHSKTKTYDYAGR